MCHGAAATEMLALQFETHEIPTEPLEKRIFIESANEVAGTRGGTDGVLDLNCTVHQNMDR